MQKSRLLEGFRAVGLVTYPLEAAILKRGAENFVTVSVKNGFQIYDTSRLRLLIVSSPRTPHTIAALAAHGDFTFAAVGREVRVYKRGKEERVMDCGAGKVSMVFVFGKLLLAYTAEGVIVIFSVETLDEEDRIDLRDAGVVSASSKKTAAKITCWMHPPTYLNKVLLGDSEGGLHILNIRSKKCVHSFAALGSEVTAMDQAPAVDVVAVGLADGRVLVQNIKFDETVMEFRHTDGRVTGLSFRTDSPSVLVSASSGGGVHVWDLENQRLQASLPQAHSSAVCTCSFLLGEPLLLTTGADNAIRLWIFDQDDGSARLLRERSGHSAPPTRVRYYSQHSILSSGLDRSFRMFSTIQDQQSRELSQGKVTKKAKIAGAVEEHVRLPPVIDFSASAMRESDWSNVITCHEKTGAVYTWRYKNAVMGTHVLRPPPITDEKLHGEKKKADGEIDVFGKRKGGLPGQIADYEAKSRNKGAPKDHNKTMALCVCVTQCGNFGVVGYSCGRVDKYNLQSGQHRGTYHQGGHEDAVYGVAVDGLNDVLVSGGFDGMLLVWDFEKREVVHRLAVHSPVNQMVLNREGGMLAVSTDDLKVRIVDLATKRLVRVFDGHSNRITDMAMSPDGRWAATVSSDCTMRIYDVPSARLIDWLSFERAVTGVSFSPSGDFVCLSLADSVGVYLWSNRAHFAGVFMGAAAPDKPTEMRLPGAAGEEDEGEGEGGGDKLASDYPPLSEQIEPTLITFSTVPKPRWQTLANLDVIKERNKPVEPAQAPKQAPFFLPTLPGLAPIFVPEEEGKDNELGKGSRVMDMSVLRASTRFVKGLRSSHQKRNPDYSECIEALKEMTPSAVDLEIRSLAVMGEGGGEVGMFLDMLSTEMAKGRDFEVLQAYLAAFLRIHEVALIGHEGLQEKLGRLGGVQGSMWSGLKGDFQQVMCLVSAFSNIQ